MAFIMTNVFIFQHSQEIKNLKEVLFVLYIYEFEIFYDKQGIKYINLIITFIFWL